MTFFPLVGYITFLFTHTKALNRTLYLAFPELLKFMLCVWLLFVAFSLTGYIVLGPFHPKFATFYESFESLFGLLNGDDIAASFDKIDIDDDRVAYLYSRVFLYAFLVLFIYFVLNLFTSLVIAAYEASKVHSSSCLLAWTVLHSHNFGAIAGKIYQRWIQGGQRGQLPPPPSLFNML